jgi:predicted membrane protein
MMHDIMIILVMTFPMFLFMIYPGIWLSNYVSENYKVNESQKRTIMVVTTFIGALILSSLLYYV